MSIPMVGISGGTNESTNGELGEGRAFRCVGLAQPRRRCGHRELLEVDGATVVRGSGVFLIGPRGGVDAPVVVSLGAVFP